MFSIDKFTQKPIYEQIIDGIEKDIILGVLCEGGAIPSVRELSLSLGINPNTIQKAYIELERRNIIVPIPGRGSFVSSGAVDAIRARAEQKLDDILDIARELCVAGVEYEKVLSAIARAYHQTKEEEK